MRQQEQDSKNNFYNIRNMAAILLGIAALFFYSCSNDIEKVKSFSSDETLPTADVTDIETMFTDSGKVLFYMKAPRVLRFETNDGNYAEFPEGVILIQYNQQKEITSSISANYAKQLLDKKKWEVRNNVIATNVRGDTLKTEHLYWDDAADRIYTDKYVKIIKEDNTVVSGEGLEANETLTKVRIVKPYDGTFYINLKDKQDSIQQTEPNKDKRPAQPLQKINLLEK